MTSKMFYLMILLVASIAHAESVIVQTTQAFNETWVDGAGELTTADKGRAVTLIQVKRLSDEGKTHGVERELGLYCEAFPVQLLVDEDVVHFDEKGEPLKEKGKFKMQKAVPPHFLDDRKKFGFGGTLGSHCRRLRDIVNKETTRVNAGECELYFKLDTEKNLQWIHVCKTSVEVGDESGNSNLVVDPDKKCAAVIGFFGQKIPNRRAANTCKNIGVEFGARMTGGPGSKSRAREPVRGQN